MRSVIVLLSTLALTMLTSFSSSTKLTITSKAFENNGPIPRKYTCEGRGISPPLEIWNIPLGTQSLAITVHDPDAALDGGYTHWVVWNISPTRKIRRHFRKGEAGPNTIGEHKYKGLCPSLGIHHYHFKVYALDTKLDIDRNTYKAGLEEKMRGHILAEGELVGVYMRKKLPASGGATEPKNKKKSKNKK